MILIVELSILSKPRLSGGFGRDKRSFLYILLGLGLALFSIFIFPILGIGNINTNFSYFGIILIVSLMFALDMIVKNIKEVPYRILFSILDEVYFRWVFLHALFTIRNQNNWGTR